MKPFRVVTGVAAPLPLADVDTEMILPEQHVNALSRSGFGVGMFHDLRYRPDGSPNPDFILNQAAYRRARILVAGPNLGPGSSGERAVRALDEFGIRCVISSMIDDSFRTHCLHVGVLPLVLEQSIVDDLMADAMVPQTALMTIDLELQEIVRAGNQTVHFDVLPLVRALLLRGANEIEGTLQNAGTTESSAAKRKVAPRSL